MSALPRKVSREARSRISAWTRPRAGAATWASTRSRSRSPVARAIPATRSPSVSDQAVVASSASGSRANSVPLAPATAQPAARACTPLNSRRARLIRAEPRISWNGVRVPLGDTIRRLLDGGIVDRDGEPSGHERGRARRTGGRAQRDRRLADLHAFRRDPAREDLQRFVVRLDARDPDRGARMFDLDRIDPQRADQPAAARPRRGSSRCRSTRRASRRGAVPPRW